MYYKNKVLSKYFDHTLLKPDATTTMIQDVVEEAIRYQFASVCVHSCHVPLVASLLTGSDVKVCAVIGFPLGVMATSIKVAETVYCIESKAHEIDMVINIGYLKRSEDHHLFQEDIARVVETCHSNHVICKVILETCLLSEEEKKIATRIALEVGADYVKTSTGFSTSGATIDDVKLLSTIAHSYHHHHESQERYVKASGGIRDGNTAISMIDAGADRLGTSATVKVYEECVAILENTASDRNDSKSNDDNKAITSSSLTSPSSLY